MPVRIDVLTDYMVRIRAATDGVFAPTLPEKDGFLRSNWPHAASKLAEVKGGWKIEAAGIALEVRNKPFQLALYQKDRVLTSSVASGVCFGKDDLTLTMATPPDEQFLGFGYQGARISYPFAPDRSPFNHRGHFVLAAGLSSHRHYYVPFFESSKGYGFFLNTLTLTSWDMARTQPDRYSVKANESRLDLYLIGGPLFRDILQRYSELVGRPPIPPKWELGGEASAKLMGVDVKGKVPYHGWNVRWFDQKQVEAAARKIRADHVPVDYFHFDSGWQTIRNSFDWVSQLPDPKGMLELLNRLNFKPGLWQRPTPVVGDYPLFREAETKGYLVTTPDGKPVVSHATPGGEVKALIDFTNPAAVSWWQEKLRALVSMGARSFKLDSESSGLEESFAEIWDLKFHNGMTGRDLENYYGPLYIKTVWDALRESLAGRRASLHVFHQAYFAANRFPYIGLGDRNHHSAPEVRVRDALNLSLCGVAFWTGGGISSFGLPSAPLDLRIQMIPYTYSYWRVAQETGLPVIRPMVLEFQDDPESFKADTQYLYGHELLVAPALESGPATAASTAAADQDEPVEPPARQFRQLYLPAGEWVNFWTKEKYLGPGKQFFAVQAGKEPVLVRGGAIIPLGPSMEWIGQKPVDPLTLEVYPNGESNFTLYEDDGDTYAYASGAYSTTLLRSRELDGAVEVVVDPAKGSYTGMPDKRAYIVKVFGTTRPKAVLIGGRELARLDSQQPERAASGWWYSVAWPGYSRAVIVKVPAASVREAVKVRLEGSVPIRNYF